MRLGAFQAAPVHPQPIGNRTDMDIGRVGCSIAVRQHLYTDNIERLYEAATTQFMDTMRNPWWLNL